MFKSKEDFDTQYPKKIDNPYSNEQLAGEKADKITGYHLEPRTVPMPVSFLSKVPGRNNEQLHMHEEPRLSKLPKLTQSMIENGYDQDSPVTLEYDNQGNPWMYEGNTRTKAAHNAGIEYIPTEIRYLGGGERFADAYNAHEEHQNMKQRKANNITNLFKKIANNLDIGDFDISKLPFDKYHNEFFQITHDFNSKEKEVPGLGHGHAVPKGPYNPDLELMDTAPDYKNQKVMVPMGEGENNPKAPRFYEMENPDLGNTLRVSRNAKNDIMPKPYKNADDDLWVEQHPGRPTARHECLLRLPVSWLKNVPGMRGEHQVLHLDMPKIKAISEHIEDKTWQRKNPITLNVLHNGKTIVEDGNHRIRAAVLKKVDSLLCKVIYYGGGEEEFDINDKLLQKAYNKLKNAGLDVNCIRHIAYGDEGVSGNSGAFGDTSGMDEYNDMRDSNTDYDSYYNTQDSKTIPGHLRNSEDHPNNDGREASLNSVIALLINDILNIIASSNKPCKGCGIPTDSCQCLDNSNISPGYTSDGKQRTNNPYKVKTISDDFNPNKGLGKL